MHPLAFFGLCFLRCVESCTALTSQAIYIYERRWLWKPQHPKKNTVEFFQFPISFHSCLRNVFCVLYTCIYTWGLHFVLLLYIAGRTWCLLTALKFP